MSTHDFWSIVFGAAVLAVCPYLLVRSEIRRRHLALETTVVTIALVLPALGAIIFPILSNFVVLPIIAIALILARLYRTDYLVVLDIAALLATFFTVAQFLLQRVHPGALILALAVFYWLWEEGRRTTQWQRPRGIVLGEFLILNGTAGAISALFGSGPLLASGLFVGMLSIAAGTALLATMIPRFLRTREEHRIIEDVSVSGEAIQPEYSPPSPECPHPELWRMYDSMSAEVEVLDFLKQLVVTLKPKLVVETGTFTAMSTLAIAQGLRQNGFGRIITVEYDPRVFAKAKERIDASGLASWIDCRNQSSLDLTVNGPIDLLFCDSDLDVRERELRHFLPDISPAGVILMHDSNSHQKIVREAALRLASEGLIAVVLLPTPRGLVIAQKLSGRK